MIRSDRLIIRGPCVGGIFYKRNLKRQRRKVKQSLWLIGWKTSQTNEDIDKPNTSSSNEEIDVQYSDIEPESRRSGFYRENTNDSEDALSLNESDTTATSDSDWNT